MAFLRIPDLTIVLTGGLGCPDTLNLKAFWRGFILLQRALPADADVVQIAAYGGRPELAGLVRVAYAPSVERYEDESLLCSELISRTEPAACFKSKIESLRSVLTLALSRSRAALLMEQLPNKGGRVLFVDWDLGGADPACPSPLTIDFALPEDCLYLSYGPEVDEGYDLRWLLAPWQIAYRLKYFDSFVSESLAGRNRYLELLTEVGWPRARVRAFRDVALSHPWALRGRFMVAGVLTVAKRFSSGTSLLSRVARRLAELGRRIKVWPPVTAENSCVPGVEQKLPVFPFQRALNIRSLFKYFILSEGLRDRTRFLAGEDFELGGQCGHLINPQAITLIVQEGSEVALGRLSAESKLPLVAIYHLSGAQVREYLTDSQGHWTSSTLAPIAGSMQEPLIHALGCAERRVGKSGVILIMPSVERYLDCSDWFYLNALTKCIAWGGVDYVRLDCPRSGRPHPDFPKLQFVEGLDVFSLSMAAGTVAGIRGSLDYSIRELATEGQQMPPKFVTLASEKSLF